MKRKKLKKLPLIILLIISAVIVYMLLINKETKKENTYTMFLASSTKNIELFDSTLNKVKDVVRGNKVTVLKMDKDCTVQCEHTKIKLNNDIYYVNKTNLVDDVKKVVQETVMYVRTASTLYNNLDTSSIGGLANKGDTLNIVDYVKLLEDGSVDAYKIKKDDKEYYIYSKYLANDMETALKNYDEENTYLVHKNRGDRYGGGDAGDLDYYPVVKAKFENNVMPDKVYSLYLNGGSDVIGNVDKYIEFAKKTKINAFVVDIKDNESPAYKSKVYEELSPTNYKYGINSFDNYKTAIKKIKDAGFYVIGRITVFKDKYYILDHEDSAISDTRTNKPYMHSSTYWPSAYRRDVWEFNVLLAKEAVTEMGFNEIQFDYVRFPDRTYNAEKNGLMDFHNVYNEDKAQAVQRFLMYACDELHKLNVYVSADVFGESAYNYVTAYGQYFPAISNVVDVISAMPYPDHFNAHDFGFVENVWEVPYKLLKHWGTEYAEKRQKEIETPAIARTWILAQNTIKGYAYGTTEVEDQIKALFDSGLTGGYMTWSSSSSLSGYQSRSGAYSREY